MFSVGHASGSSSTLETALTRIDDAKEASRCRDRLHAVGYRLGTSRKVHKLRDISSSLCIDVNRSSHVSSKRRKVCDPKTGNTNCSRSQNAPIDPSSVDGKSVLNDQSSNELSLSRNVCNFSSGGADVQLSNAFGAICTTQTRCEAKSQDAPT